MTDLTPLSRDAQMVRRMAEANGLDLATLTRSGKISADQVSDVVQSCGRCANKGGCTKWLDQHATPAPTTPGFCRNKPWFDGLTGG